MELEHSEVNVEVLLKDALNLFSKSGSTEQETLSCRSQANKLFNLAEQQLIKRELGYVESVDFRLAALYLFSGKVLIDLDDVHAAESQLNKCLTILDQASSDSKFWRESCSTRIEALNSIAILVSEKERYVEAEAFLLKARTGFRDYNAVFGEDSPPFSPSSIILGKTTEESEVKEWKKCFDSAYTYTLYYSAQVAMKMDDKTGSTKYCEETLERQLLYPENFDALDFGLNCATISQYFLGESVLSAAVHYLACAFAIESLIRKQFDDPISEKPAEYVANVNRCLAKLGLEVLELTADERTILPSEQQVNLFQSHSSSMMRALNVDVGNSERSLLALSKLPTNYDEIRNVFLVTQRAINAAREFFTVDTHCTDFILATQDYSRLFKLMARLDMDPSRCLAMHKRRVTLLTELIDSINPQHYLMRYRQLVYERAETFSKMVDIALSELPDEKSGVPLAKIGKKVEKLNECIDLSIASYRRYIDSLKQPLGDPKAPMPDPIPQQDLRPTLVAYLAMGNLQSKCRASPFAGTDERIQYHLANLQKASDFYSLIVNYCDTHPEAVELVKAELDSAREMNGLMFVKMENVRQGGRA